MRTGWKRTSILIEPLIVFMGKLMYQKRLSTYGMRNWSNPTVSQGCNYLPMPCICASGAKILIIKRQPMRHRHMWSEKTRDPHFLRFVRIFVTKKSIRISVVSLHDWDYTCWKSAYSKLQQKLLYRKAVLLFSLVDWFLCFAIVPLLIVGEISIVLLRNLSPARETTQIPFNWCRNIFCRLCNKIAQLSLQWNIETQKYKNEAILVLLTNLTKRI